MAASITPRAEQFVGRVEQLYALADRVAQSLRSAVSRRPVHLNEEAVGEYDLDELALDLDGKALARFIPVGASILGADGRVDLKGAFGEETLLFLRSGDPERQLSVAVADAGAPREGARSYQIFRNVHQDGWYWIESVRLGKAKLVTADLLAELIAAVN